MKKLLMISTLILLPCHAYSARPFDVCYEGTKVPHEKLIELCVGICQDHNAERRGASTHPSPFMTERLSCPSHQSCTCESK